MTLKRIYYRLLLAVLPSVEQHLQALADRIEKLDALTDKFERALEEEVVKLAHDAQNRRKAIEAVNATYDRRDESSVGLISTIRADLDKAEHIRTRVSDFLKSL